MSGPTHEAKPAALIAEVGKTWTLRPKIVVHGFSAGAQFAHRFAFKHPEQVAGVSAHSGGSWAKLEDDDKTNPQRKASSSPSIVAKTTTAAAAHRRGSTRIDGAKQFSENLKSLGFTVELRTWPGVAHGFAPGLMPMTKALVEKARAADIVVYSTTAGGVTASVAAARQGATVVLVEPGHHVGGMLSGGLGHSDVGGQPQIIGGLAREVYERMARRYGSPDASKAFDFEPHVAEETLREMLREAGVRVVFGERVETVEKADQRLVAMTTQSGNRYEARVFIDAGYEGDLMAKAGVRYTVGREGKAQYGEWLAGRMELLPGQHRHVRLQYRHLRGAVGLGARVPFSESGG